MLGRLLPVIGYYSQGDCQLQFWSRATLNAASLLQPEFLNRLNQKYERRVMMEKNRISIELDSGVNSMRIKEINFGPFVEDSNRLNSISSCLMKIYLLGGLFDDKAD